MYGIYPASLFYSTFALEIQVSTTDLSKVQRLLSFMFASLPLLTHSETDANFLSNAFIAQYSNAGMGLNVINWLSELDYHVFIDQKEIKVERLELTSKQKRTVAVMLFVMPILIAAGGVIAWLKQQS